MKNGFVCLLIFAAVACETIKDPGETVTGLWKLSIVEVQDSVTGGWSQADWMKNGSGYLHYDGSQFMSAHFLPEGYNDMEVIEDAANNVDKIRSEDYWYLAKYSMDSQSGTLTHKRFLHSDPSQRDLSVERRYEFHGDTLYLFADEFNFRLKWVRP